MCGRIRGLFDFDVFANALAHHRLLDDTDCILFEGEDNLSEKIRSLILRRHGELRDLIPSEDERPRYRYFSNEEAADDRSVDFWRRYSRKSPC